MAKDGIDISNHTSNTLEEYKNTEISHVITVCDHANESCPVYLKKVNLTHQNFLDPSKFIGNEFEIQKDEDLTLAKKALVENRYDGINQVHDICNRPAQNCNSSSKFRTITGTCNNLNHPYWGAANTPFTREIEVGVYYPKTDIAISDKNNHLSGK